jgi:hypothetical protein
VKTATWFDRTEWPADDPRWSDEPDRAEWRDDATGLVCLARRGPGGQWCGYVAVPPGHPWHGLGYSDCTTSCGEDWCDHSTGSLCDVHGGLTFAGPCMKDDPIQGVCHVPEPGEPADVWWFGFDCAHAWDYAPDREARMRTIPGLPTRSDALSEDIYRPLEYVRGECTRLAATLGQQSAQIEAP